MAILYNEFSNYNNSNDIIHNHKFVVIIVNNRRVGITIIMLSNNHKTGIVIIMLFKMLALI